MSNSRDPAVRMVIIRTVLKGRRLLTQSAKMIGETPEQALCTMAIRLGQYEGRPMSISDVAGATGLPYATADRYLKTLKRKGFIRSERVGRRVVHFIPGNTETAVTTAFYRDFDKLITEAGNALKKLTDAL